MKITNAFQKVLKESDRQLDRTLDQWNHDLGKNYIEMYSTHNKGESVVA